MIDALADVMPRAFSSRCAIVIDMLTGTQIRIDQDLGTMREECHNLRKLSTNLPRPICSVREPCMFTWSHRTLLRSRAKAGYAADLGLTLTNSTFVAK